MTVLQDLIKFKYSSGMSVLDAALSKKSLTCSKNLGSWNSSIFEGPYWDGSNFAGSIFVAAAAAEKFLISKQK